MYNKLVHNTRAHRTGTTHDIIMNIGRSRTAAAPSSGGVPLLRMCLVCLPN